MKTLYTLENWAVVYNGDPYTAPELRTQSLAGTRYGKSITTSMIIGKSGNCIVTRNSLYMLGKVDPNYEAVYPNARGRLFESLDEVDDVTIL